jgi:hypothetical protein
MNNAIDFRSVFVVTLYSSLTLFSALLAWTVN